MSTPSDRLAIIIIEALLFAFALFAIVRAARLRRQHGGATLTVMRGPESRKKLGLVYGFASVNTLQLINISDAFNGHKVVLSVVDPVDSVLPVFPQLLVQEQDPRVGE